MDSVEQLRSSADLVTRTHLDEVKRIELQRMRRIATGALVGISIVFVALQYAGDSVAVELLKAISEAAMVGGLADWFAVTALFRYPLGIPIPHTAVVPNNRDRIAASLGNFIQLNFLSAERMGEKVRELNLAGYVGRWLNQPENSRLLADKAGSLALSTRQVLSDDAIQKFVRTYASGWARTLDVAKLLGDTLTNLTQNERFQPLFEEIMRAFVEALKENREQLLAAVHRTLPALVPNLVGTVIFNAVEGHMEKTVNDMLARPDHEIRRLVEEKIHDYVEKLKTDPATIDRINVLASEYFGQPEMALYVSQVWRDLKGFITDDLESDSSKIKAYLASLAQKAGDAMLEDPAFQRAVNNQLEREAIRLAERYASSISGFITETVQRWRTETMVERIELGVGKDLQYIRLNGTIVGGLVGGILYGLSYVF